MPKAGRYPTLLAAALLGLAVTSCSRDTDEAPAAPNQPQAQPSPSTTQDTPPPATGMNCDMSQDMSKMTAEEHRQMMERCQKQSAPQSAPDQ